VAAHDKLFGRYTDKHFAPSRVLVTSQTQAIEWHLTAKDRATAKPVGVSGIALVTTRDDGTIGDIHLCFDQGVVQAQVSGEPKDLADGALASQPSGPREDVEQSGSREEAAHADVAVAAVAALAGDEATYLGAYRDDAEVHTLQRARPLAGKKDLRSYYQM